MGDRFHFIVDGNSDCPPILFLHGFLGSCHDFESVVSNLKSDFYCIRIDLPGHGYTHWAGDYTMEQTAGAIVQFLTDHHIAQANLVGYSMGGRLALYLALHFPEQFPKAVIESASPGLKSAAERQARLQQDVALADQLEADFLQFLAEWYAQPLFESLKQHPSFAKVLEQRSQNHPAGLAKSLRRLSTGRQPSLWETLPAHRNPLLLVVGEHDRKFVAINQAIAALAPTAQLTIIPHSGHVVHIEQPATFTNRVATFLQENILFN